MPPVAGAVVLEEGIAVGAVGERNVEDLGVFERLLHAGADGVVVVLGLDDGDRDVRLVEEDVVGLLGLAALDRLAANDDAALGEVDLLANLGHHVPLAAVRADERGRDELGADVRFGEVLLVHSPDLIYAESEPRPFGAKSCFIDFFLGMRLTYFGRPTTVGAFLDAF